MIFGWPRKVPIVYLYWIYEEEANGNDNIDQYIKIISLEYIIVYIEEEYILIYDWSSLPAGKLPVQLTVAGTPNEPLGGIGWIEWIDLE